MPHGGMTLHTCQRQGRVNILLNLNVRRCFSTLWRHLVQEVLNMIQAEFLSGVDNPVQVRFHEVGHDVDVLKLF